MEYILFAVALLTALFFLVATVVGTLAFAYYNPQEGWVRHIIKGVVFVILWVFMNSI